ncbi:hypothetical protein PybrP1_007430 [[Pythium] brassicae (nom. inval.)]|nr:hypothetical protein PybrP1_007430 [[Pythium] brassicae (nom. inval.)]
MLATTLLRSLLPVRAWTSAASAAPAPLLLQRWLSTGADRKQPVELREADLVESFVKGSGKGGQKINKVRNCVLLKHTPTGLLVRCQKTRSLDDNRRVARKLLAQKLDDHLNGALSARSLKFARLRKRKASKKAKSRQKYAAAGERSDDDDDDGDSESDDEWDDDDDDDEEDDDEGEDDEGHGRTHAFKAKTRARK